MRTAAAQFAFGHAQHLGQAEHQRRTVQAVLAHEVGAHAGEVAFVAAGEALVEQGRHGQAEHGVPQELEPLVVLGAEAAVRERVQQQRLSRKCVTDASLQCLQGRRIHGGRPTSSAPRT